MTLKTLTDDQVVVRRETQAVALGRADADPKGVDGGSDADKRTVPDQETDADSSDRGVSDHSADSDSTDHDSGESGSTTTPQAPDSSDRGPSQPR
jgi:hypothetical protein